jgi:hypothetical protein
MSRTAVLAFSGGLDTTCAIAWLKEDYGFDEDERPARRCARSATSVQQLIGREGSRPGACVRWSSCAHRRSPAAERRVPSRNSKKAARRRRRRCRR